MTARVPIGPHAGRYGPVPTPGARRRARLALWALGLGGLAVTVWLGIGAARTPVTWSDVGFVVEGSRQVEVVFDVARPDPSVAVRCRLQALNEQYGEVGVLVVDVPPAQAREVRLRSVVATSEAAVTGLVDSCWVP